MGTIIVESKRILALEACDKVINGIEDESISVLSALLQCKKIARLVDDFEGMEWLEYEYGGYPRRDDGHLTDDAIRIASTHGRVFQDKDSKGIVKSYTFIDLCSELEALNESYRKAINNYSTQGLSVSGDLAVLAVNNLTNSINRNVNNLLSGTKIVERKLSSLKAQYYDYAVKWQIELSFGNTAKSVFEEYQGYVDKYFNSLSDSTVLKLKAIESLMDQDNRERYSQVLTSCRRLWADVSKQLFDEVLPDYSASTFRTRSGKEIDVTGEHYNNKLSAVIETLQNKSTRNTLVGSETVYLVDWMERINDLQSSGVHSEISRGEARQCIIHTYIALGDILNLKQQVLESNQ